MNRSISSQTFSLSKSTLVIFIGTVFFIFYARCNFLMSPSCCCKTWEFKEKALAEPPSARRGKIVIAFYNKWSDLCGGHPNYILKLRTNVKTLQFKARNATLFTASFFVHQTIYKYKDQFLKGHVTPFLEERWV